MMVVINVNACHASPLHAERHFLFHSLQVKIILEKDLVICRLLHNQNSRLVNAICNWIISIRNTNKVLWLLLKYCGYDTSTTFNQNKVLWRRLKTILNHLSIYSIVFYVCLQPAIQANCSAVYLCPLVRALAVLWRRYCCGLVWLTTSVQACVLDPLQPQEVDHCSRILNCWRNPPDEES